MAPEVELGLYNVIKNKIEVEINVENRMTVTTEIAYR